MAHARQRAAREIVVAQAAFVWLAMVGVTEDGINEFIRCGEVPGDAPEPALPYNEDVIKSIAESGAFHGSSR